MLYSFFFNLPFKFFFFQLKSLIFHLISNLIFFQFIFILFDKKITFSCVYQSFFLHLPPLSKYPVFTVAPFLKKIKLFFICKILIIKTK